MTLGTWTELPVSRVLIVGLDGASPRLLHRWRDRLPNLNRLMSDGASGVLESILPPRSIPAWYCFATGMNPAKIGVFGFSQRRPGTYDYTFANLTFCRAPTLWDWLGQFGMRTVIVHVPGTYPPPRTNGLFVSGWPAPKNRGALVYANPPELSRELDGLLGRPFEFLSDLPMRLDNDREVLAERIRITRMHGEVGYRLLSRGDWQVGAVVFSPIDRASHQFWRHIDAAHPLHDPRLAKELGDALYQVYQAADDEIGRLLTLLSPEDYVLVVSDHGFGPAHRVFYLNEWLRSQGLLVLKEDSSATRMTRRSAVTGRLSVPLFWLNSNSGLFRRLAAPFKKRALSNLLRDDYVRRRNQGLVRINHMPVDWSRTVAYCPDEGSLYLNLQGRDPEGIVQAGPEAADILGRIEAGLREIADPETGRPVKVETWRKESIYSGPYLEDAPDLLIALDDCHTEVMAEMGAGSWFAPAGARNGTHDRDGVIIAHGPAVVRREDVRAGLMDIAPTVYHLMGTPMPDECDGRVLLDLFAHDSPVNQRKVQRAQPEAAGTASGEVYSDSELDQVEKQLRDLGYLG